MSSSFPPIFNPNFGGVPVAQDRPCWASARAEALSYSAVKYATDELRENTLHKNVLRYFLKVRGNKQSVTN